MLPVDLQFPLAVTTSVQCFSYSFNEDANMTHSSVLIAVATHMVTVTIRVIPAGVNLNVARISPIMEHTTDV